MASIGVSCRLLPLLRVAVLKVNNKFSFDIFFFVRKRKLKLTYFCDYEQIHCCLTHIETEIGCHRLIHRFVLLRFTFEPILRKTVATTTTTT